MMMQKSDGDPDSSDKHKIFQKKGDTLTQSQQIKGVQRC
jgi:hypothetical protein